MHLGLFGGSFDPPHVGHLVVAETLREAFALDRVVWMPAARPPHKPGHTLAPAADRLAMVRLAVAGNAAFEVSDLELRRADETGVPSYTVDTLRALHAAYPGAAWSLLIGEDSLATFGSWREPAEIARLARLVVYRRAGAGAASAGPFAHDARFADAGPLDVSSTDLRARLRAGRSVRYLVPDAVGAYASAHGLYR